MTAFTVWRNSSLQSFDGKLLACVEGNRVTSEEGEHGYKLLVYRITNGGFVAAIEFLSTLIDKDPLSMADEMDTLKDVEDFFFAFEPAELLPPTLGKTLTREERSTLLCKLYNEFELQVTETLQLIESHVSTEKTSDQLPA